MSQGNQSQVSLLQYCHFFGPQHCHSLPLLYRHLAVDFFSQLPKVQLAPQFFSAHGSEHPVVVLSPGLHSF